MKKARQNVSQRRYGIWLDDIIGGSQLLCFRLIALAGRSGINNYGNGIQEIYFPDLFETLPAVQARHIQIEKDKIGAEVFFPVELPECFHTIAGGIAADGGINLFQCQYKNVLVVYIIVY